MNQIIENINDFDFYVVPMKAEFLAEKGGASRHLMVNGTNHRLAIKIKCSNNKLYRVLPVYTCIDPGKTKRLQILRDPGYGKIDKLILIYMPTRYRNARFAFETNSNIDGETIFTNIERKKTLIALITKNESIIENKLNENVSKQTNDEITMIDE